MKLQSVEVQVRSTDTGLSVADRFAGIYDRIATPIGAQLKDFGYDLRPLLADAYDRVARPIELPIGDARGCARLRVLEVEAGPTVLADGIEKDIALVVAPSITLPCADPADDLRASLPPMSNVATVMPGPFTVTIPIAARYDELTRAMSMAFTDGKLFFSAEYPGLYLEKPEIYESQGQLVLKLHIHGPVHKLGIDSDLDGDLFLVGHPSVIDNELSIPDLEPTIETRSFLLSLKAMTDGDRIRDEARQAASPRPRRASARRAGEARRRAHLRARGRVLPRRRRRDRGHGRPPARRVCARVRGRDGAGAALDALRDPRHARHARRVTVRDGLQETDGGRARTADDPHETGKIDLARGQRSSSWPALPPGAVVRRRPRPGPLIPRPRRPTLTRPPPRRRTPTCLPRRSPSRRSPS